MEKNRQKAAAGRKGARALRAKVEGPGAPRGAFRELMRDLGSRGGRATWAKYQRVPVGTSQFAIVRRSDGQVMRYENRY